MKIYSIEVNKQDYRKLEFTKDYSTTDRLPVDNEGRISDWDPPACRFIDADKPFADFMLLGSDAIVYDIDYIERDFAPEHQDERSFNTLLEMACYGEEAPITVEDNDRFRVVMVTECNNALDRTQSQWQVDEAGNPTTIDKFVFHESRIFTMSGLFRLADPDFDKQYTFAYTASEDEETKFLERYFEYNKTGLVLNEVWSS